MISVVTATYNRADTLSRTLDSLLNQTYPDWECVLVDDGSTDRTSEVIARYTDPRIRVYSHPVNRGVNAAKNTGLDVIRGEWFTLVDSDDELVPEAFAVVLDVAQRTGAEVVISNGMNSTTGEFTGVGPSHEGFLTPQESAALRGDHWGINRTSLLGDLRFCEGLAWGDPTLWTRLYATTRRYYVDLGLLIVHTQATDRVSQRRRSLREKIDIYTVLSKEPEYLHVLRRLNPPEYRRTVLRIWAARILGPIVSRG